MSECWYDTDCIVHMCAFIVLPMSMEILGCVYNYIFINAFLVSGDW